MQEIPRYIENAAVVDAPILFDWGRAQQEDVLLDQPRLMSRLNETTYRGVLAFALGVVEWVSWRLVKYIPDQTPFHFIEASWASLIDWRYLRSLDVPDWENELDEPIGAPLTLAFQLLIRVHVAARRVKPVSQHAAPLSELPLKLMPNPEPYKEWRRDAIARLVQRCPKDEQNWLGSPVPREVLDPKNDYRPARATDLLGRFLSGCDPRQNPYLVSANELKAKGFEGMPYTL